MMRSPFLKRALDVLCAAGGLLMLAPLLLGVALLVRLTMGSPVLFRQRRPGLHGKPFTVLKFRTMRDARDAAGNVLPDAQRLTRLGKFLRSTSLDEFPELINVLRGEMSLVGPRPLLMEYLPYYTEREQQRHLVRPGITGLAQVSGRNQLSWDERLEIDARYVETWNLWLDLRLLLVTLWKVVRRSEVLVVPGLTQETLVAYRRRQGIGPAPDADAREGRRSTRC